MAARQDQRIVRDFHQGLKIGIDPAKECPEVVVLAEEGMEAPAHRDVIIAVSHRP